MWRLSVVILAVALGVHSAPTEDENGLIQRLKRSPYCPPEFPPPPPPPPPPPHFGPPHFGPPHHHHFGEGYSEANSQAISGQYQQYSEGQGQNYQNFGGQEGQGTGSCDTCKGQNSAISNAQSGTGNAVAIAVSKG